MRRVLRLMRENDPLAPQRQPRVADSKRPDNTLLFILQRTVGSSIYITDSKYSGYGCETSRRRKSWLGARGKDFPQGHNDHRLLESCHVPISVAGSKAAAHDKADCW